VSNATTTTTSPSPTTAPKEGGILAPVETRVAALTTNPKVGEVYTLALGSNVTMELMGIPPGEFLLGSTKEEQAWALVNGGKAQEVKREGEMPRKAAIKQGFWLGRTEVTVGQWKQFVAATRYQTDAERKGYVDGAPQKGQGWNRADGSSWRDPGFGSPQQDNHPVCCVSWNDAVAFCEWLTEQERKAGRLLAAQVVRLPTEVEWEYACRAGTQTKFWWGESKEDGNGRLNWKGPEDGFEFVAPVDAFGPQGRNGFGLADMLGNMLEWCLDGYDETQAHEKLWIDNTGQRVLRCGGFRNDPAYCRCAYRFGRYPSRTAGDFGFRVAVAPVQ
jgi:formylglycine-generating enzyme required for sulfatase activity